MKRILTVITTLVLCAALAWTAGCTDADGDGIDDSEECSPGQSDPDGDGRCPDGIGIGG
jgi:hypothetical protein